MKRHVISIIATVVSGKGGQPGAVRRWGLLPPAVKAVWARSVAASGGNQSQDAVQTRKAREETGDVGTAASDRALQERGLRHRPAVFLYAACAEKRRAWGRSFGPGRLEPELRGGEVPRTLETKRAWQLHPEWIDGDRHLLPRGPAPSRNESRTCCA